jgi:hypothetical protein
LSCSPLQLSRPYDAYLAAFSSLGESEQHRLTA